MGVGQQDHVGDTEIDENLRADTVIAQRRWLTGSVEYVDHSFRPFIRDPSGNYTLFGNTAYIPAVSTSGRGINNNNIVTGYSSTASGNGLEDRGFERFPNEALNRSG